jgi:hypothetical protein
MPSHSETVEIPQTFDWKDVFVLSTGELQFSVANRKKINFYEGIFW